ncbi:RF-1 domain-containing protein [Sphaerosporella brunnea]|uniref:RF-1 domain-containing protein n=1 Tax=Sphaerosporella brunnea TaxID=1250544 RepID=A0A5J5EJH7_9PEZI|nr:RF-1 domain-containing protein [Sphaerosporella brunnea]
MLTAIPRPRLLAAVRSFSIAAARQYQLPPRPQVDESEIREAFLKGSGPGGQKINKTNSAVQLIHEPTGIVVKSQATRSRAQNRKIARQLLAEKIDEREKGPESRLQLKISRMVDKKASTTKKARRKYRRLERALDLRRDAFMERPEEPEGWTKDFGWKEARFLDWRTPRPFKKGQKELLEWEEDFKPRPKKAMVKDSNGIMVDKIVDEEIRGAPTPMKRKRMQISAKEQECAWAWMQPGLVEFAVPEDEMPADVVKSGEDEEFCLIYQGAMGAEWKEAREEVKKAIAEGRLQPPPKPKPKHPQQSKNKLQQPRNKLQQPMRKLQHPKPEKQDLGGLAWDEVEEVRNMMKKTTV